MASNEETDQQQIDHDYAGTGTTRVQFFKRAAVLAGLLFVALAFASGYYALLNRTEPPPREIVPVESGPADTQPPEGFELRFEGNA